MLLLFLVSSVLFRLLCVAFVATNYSIIPPPRYHLPLSGGIAVRGLNTATTPLFE